MSSRLYEGQRAKSGFALVTVDGRPLRPRIDICCYTPGAYAWGAAGAGAKQLALALLAHHLGDDKRALDFHLGFEDAVVRKLPTPWRLTSAELDASLSRLETVLTVATPSRLVSCRACGRIADETAAVANRGRNANAEPWLCPDCGAPVVRLPEHARRPS